MIPFAAGLGLLVVVSWAWRGRSSMARAWVGKWMLEESILVALPGLTVLLLLSSVTALLAPQSDVGSWLRMLAAIVIFSTSIAVVATGRVPAWWGPQWRHEEPAPVGARIDERSGSSPGSVDRVRAMTAGTTGVIFLRQADDARYRTMKVLVDGEPLASVGWNDQVVIALEPGRHAVSASMDWVRSEEALVDVTAGGVTEVRGAWRFQRGGAICGQIEVEKGAAPT